MTKTTLLEYADLDTIIQTYQALPGATLPILHAIQNTWGYIPNEALPRIAEALNISHAEIHGIISFYHHFRRTPPSRHIVQICRAESCLAMGATSLEAHARATLDIENQQNNGADAVITLEPVHCLGNCACSPSIRIDDELYGRMTPDRFDALITALRQHLDTGSTK